MSKYGIKYEIEFTNCELDGNYLPDPQTVNIGIYDTTSVIDDAAEVTVISLTPGGDPLHLVSIDNSEDKFTGIRPQQAVIKFLSDENFDLSIFTDTSYFTTPVGDPRYYVEIYVTRPPFIKTFIIFKGWLTFDDCSEAFMPTPNVVTLTATDGLGWLKEKELVLLVNDPSNMYRIADYLAGALAQTGLSLRLNVAFNIREVTYSSDHIFHKVWLSDKTFEKEVGVYEDCFTVIEKILGEEASLFQWNGQWWIVRPDEADGLFYRSTFDSLGAFGSAFAGTSTLQFAINKDSGAVFFSQEATEVVPQSEHKWVKETYNFEFPEELVCNINYDRGDFIADLADENNEDGLLCNVKSYVVDCTNNIHTPPSYVPGATSFTPATHQAYIKRLFINNREQQRYFVLPTTSSGTDLLEFGTLRIGNKDKINVHIDFRWPEDEGGSGTINLNTIIFVTLKGDDDTNWHLIEDGTWVSSGSGGTWSPLNGIGLSWLREDVDERDWRTVGADSKPAPVSGMVRVTTISIGSVAGTVDDHDMYYSNLNIEYIPFVDGSYKESRFISDKAYQPTGYRAKREKTVYVSDGIRPVFKGAFFILQDGNYTMTNTFFNWAAVQSTTPADEFIHPYLHIQTYDVWNQYRNVMRIFHATAQGLQSNLTLTLDTDLLPYPSPAHRFILQDSSRHTANKIFAMLTFDLDFFTCEWKGTLAEVFDSVKGKRYDDPEEVKYG